MTQNTLLHDLILKSQTHNKVLIEILSNLIYLIYSAITQFYLKNNGGYLLILKRTIHILLCQLKIEDIKPSTNSTVQSYGLIY